MADIWHVGETGRKGSWMNVWRLNIKPDAQVGVDPREFCFEKTILGVGWPLDEASTEVGWEQYRERAEQKYEVGLNDKGWWRALNALHNRMEIGDLVWCRDRKGVYRLGQVTGEWRYVSTREHREADIVNVRDCEWCEVGTEDAVPGKVAQSFALGGTLRRVSDEPDDTISTFSKRLYNDCSQSPTYEVLTPPNDLFTLLGPDACEDLVGLYLQSEEGYGVVPSTCKRSTPYYEFVLHHRSTGKKAIVQVKSGTESLSIDDYAELPVDVVFLFTARGSYEGGPIPRVKCLEPVDLKRFACDNKHLMTDEIVRWMDIADCCD
jgi:hypothetical protein